MSSPQCPEFSTTPTTHPFFPSHPEQTKRAKRERGMKKDDFSATLKDSEVLLDKLTLSQYD
jgi:hypothetical protein